MIKENSKTCLFIVSKLNDTFKTEWIVLSNIDTTKRYNKDLKSFTSLKHIKIKTSREEIISNREENERKYSRDLRENKIDKIIDDVTNEINKDDYKTTLETFRCERNPKIVSTFYTNCESKEQSEQICKTLIENEIDCARGESNGESVSNSKFGRYFVTIQISRFNPYSKDFVKNIKNL